MTSEAVRRFGAELAALAQGAPGGAGTVSAQVIDVTDTGVNVEWSGTLLLDVPCMGAYRNRSAGDWVILRPGARPVVLGRPDTDPGDMTQVREAAAEVALDAQVVRAATWGTAAPPGTGWQGPVTLHMRRTADGKIELYGQLVAETEPPPPPPVPRPPRPVTITPTAYGTWRGGRPDDYASYPVQGDYTGRGDRRGGWFYGTAIAAACAGKSVAGMRLAVTRRRGAGANAKRPVHLYLHDHTSPPSGQLNLDEGPEDLLRLSVGAQGSAALPASWRTRLADGSRRGLAIYARGATDYMAVQGGAITITFTT
ncbi:hypothetical protein [Streptomyces uncialis]|uniref:hypothetical protein n=1 Tax=Streptomyces uncialis TaxID=1048205 RepID=UPI00225A55B9|nr:hypothetical protein [Streptomyces uncialis]MCX4661507.1 hypothetical protein [Streptomyces uncialis]